jgi:hypothetical protein
MTETIIGVAIAVLAILLLIVGFLVRHHLSVPMRRYARPLSVATVYDRWTTEKMV